MDGDLNQLAVSAGILQQLPFSEITLTQFSMQIHIQGGQLRPSKSLKKISQYQNFVGNSRLGNMGLALSLLPEILMSQTTLLISYLNSTLMSCISKTFLLLIFNSHVNVFK